MTASAPFIFRPGTADDSYPVFVIFRQALADLLRRLDSTFQSDMDEPHSVAAAWPEYRLLYDYLARTAEQFWVAEQGGRRIGYARSILSDGVQELTEFFVLPGTQSGGVGRELLRRAFPDVGAPYRSIIATTDRRAQALYLKAGVYPRGVLYEMGRDPAESVDVQSDLAFVPLTPDHFEVLAHLDRTIIGYRRDETHRWLMSERQGLLYTRNGQPVGYGYEGDRSGPFALLDPADFPAVLAHVESEDARHGRSSWLVVPAINQVAVDYLLARGMRMGSLMPLMMTNVPFGQLDHYLVTDPEFVL